MKLSWFVALSSLLFSLCSLSMAEIKISPLELTDSAGQYDYRFPIVSGTNEADNIIANNMNILMQLTELGTYSPTHDKTALFFNNASLPFSISYEVIYQSPELITLQLFKQYRHVPDDDNSENLNNIESYELYYVFDLSTGRLVAPSMLFTPSGLVWLNEQLVEQRGGVYDDILGKLRILLNDKNISAEEVQKQIDEVEQNKLWLVDEAAATVGLASYPSELRVMSNSLAIVGSYTNFVDKFSSAEDEALEIQYNEFVYEQLKPYLSRYGQCLFIQKTQNCQPDYQVHVVPGVWHGQLADDHIMLVITGYDPHYMDGMGHDIHGYLFLNDDDPVAVEAHGELSVVVSTRMNELNSTGIPVFRGKFQIERGNKEEPSKPLKLTFLHDGRWVSVNDNRLELIQGAQ